ncbi:MAG: outer membrane beta-barrel protein, partial [Fusobacteriaceae bacterium]
KGFGFEVAAEYMYPVHQLPGLELGLGLAFQRHAKLNSVNNDFIIGNNVLNIEREIPSFDSIPLYVVSKYKFDNWDMWGTGAKLYLKGDLGWSYNIEKGDTQFRVNQNNFDLDSDIKNGLYWGAGFGVEYDNWTADLMYKVNTAKIKGEYKGYNENFSESLDYSRITLSLGYKF